MGYLCQVPYRIGTVKSSDQIQKHSLSLFPEINENAYDETGYLCGESGCGLCALYQLQKAGITHLKLVGRGNYTDFMEKDIRNLRKALTILAASVDEPDYQKQLKRNLFPYGCSRNCYYAS